MNLSIFRLPSKKEESPPEPFPSALNPCPYGGNHGRKPHKDNYYDVGGRVTKLCLSCVGEKVQEHGDMQTAMSAFHPDPQGNPCL